MLLVGSGVRFSQNAADIAVALVTNRAANHEIHSHLYNWEDRDG